MPDKERHIAHSVRNSMGMYAPRVLSMVASMVNGPLNGASESLNKQPFIIYFL